VGIQVNLRSSPDFPTWANRVSNYDYDMAIEHITNWGDPAIGVHRSWISSNIRKGVIFSNTASYANPEIDEILERAGKETDFEKRKALYVEFQKKLVDDCPVFFLLNLPYYCAYDKKLKNVNTTIWGTMSSLHEVYWEK
jgi:peptide/nickel transport system substrate-binding protein